MPLDPLETTHCHETERLTDSAPRRFGLSQRLEEQWRCAVHDSNPRCPTRMACDHFATDAFGDGDEPTEARERTLLDRNPYPCPESRGEGTPSPFVQGCDGGINACPARRAQRPERGTSAVSVHDVEASSPTIAQRPCFAGSVPTRCTAELDRNTPGAQCLDQRTRARNEERRFDFNAIEGTEQRQQVGFDARSSRGRDHVRNL